MRNVQRLRRADADTNRTMGVRPHGFGLEWSTTASDCWALGCAYLRSDAFSSGGTLNIYILSCVGRWVAWCFRSVADADEDKTPWSGEVEFGCESGCPGLNEVQSREVESHGFGHGVMIRASQFQRRDVVLGSVVFRLGLSRAMSQENH
eukprot:1782619-Rhodomonas_salina.3